MKLALAVLICLLLPLAGFSQVSQLTSTTGTVVLLRWAPQSGALFNVYKFPDLTTPVNAPNPVQTNSFIDFEVKPGVTYTYAIAPVIGGVEGAKFPISVTTPQVAEPPPPVPTPEPAPAQTSEVVVSLKQGSKITNVSISRKRRDNNTMDISVNKNTTVKVVTVP